MHESPNPFKILHGIKHTVVNNTTNLLNKLSCYKVDTKTQTGFAPQHNMK
ncbi:MAG: hypothetical protein ACI8RD_003585 [Bacillariaceae sp.]|jgi:hypothetical protein